MSELYDAYGNPFDPRPIIARWRSGEAPGAVGTLWERLYHQGNVGSASYAAVPDLVELLETSSQPDWDAYALIATIEEARADGAELIPPSLIPAYTAAWRSVLPLAIRDLANASQGELVRSLIAVIAHAKGQHSLAAIALCSDDEREEMLG
ncbi:hypothetical protein [Novosphingobium sp. PASSN1]|uniref:hypothetical protein n=1 Tax=Novosphingobium sp. PASSN1 TaxID=2015561 RepID=UPI002600CDF8|nr:hypothetical protein [Novosphingobium sp. PASSN1]